MSDTCYPFKRIVHYSVWMTNGNCVPRSWSMLQWLLGALNVTGLCMLASKTGPSQCEPVIIFFPLEILIATKTTYMPIDIIVGRKINWAHIVGVANYSRIKIKYNIWSLPYSIQKPIFSSGPLKNHLCKNVAVKSKKKKKPKTKKKRMKNATGRHCDLCWLFYEHVVQTFIGLSRAHSTMRAVKSTSCVCDGSYVFFFCFFRSWSPLVGICWHHRRELIRGRMESFFFFR